MIRSISLSVVVVVVAVVMMVCVCNAYVGEYPSIRTVQLHSQMHLYRDIKI